MNDFIRNVCKLLAASSLFLAALVFCIVILTFFNSKHPDLMFQNDKISKLFILLLGAPLVCGVIYKLFEQKGKP